MGWMCEKQCGMGWCQALALAFACLSAGPALAQAQKANADLSAVFGDWKARQGLLKSARYVIVGTTEFKDDERPRGNPIRPRRSVLLIDVSKKRYWLEETQEVISANGVEDSARWEYRTHTRTQAYDGKARQVLYHRKANRIDDADNDIDLGISKGNLGPHANLNDDVWPLFCAHGIVPTVHSPLRVDNLPLEHDPDDFDVAGRQRLRDQNCLILRTEPKKAGGSADEFWVNPEQKSAIQRHVYGTGPAPWFRFEVFWKQTNHGWWVDHWSNTWSTGGRVRRIVRFRVESFTANPEVTDESFVLPTQPGMKVMVGEFPPAGKGLDPFTGATRTYVISPTGAWNEVSAKGFTTKDGKQLPPAGHRWWFAWAVGVLAAAVGVLLSYLYLRRRRRQRAS